MSGRLSNSIATEETLARYVLTRRWIKDDRTGPQLRPNAWVPHPNVELSVYRIDGWSDPEIVLKGHEVAAEREQNHKNRELSSGRPYPEGKCCFRYLGRGHITAQAIRDTDLDVVPKEPPVRHADIINWPPLQGNKKLDEAAQLLLAEKLAAKAVFIPAV